MSANFRVYITNFYPRSPCGERQGTLNLWDAHRVFLSTLSLRRATKIRLVAPDISSISIHALLAESDSSIEEVSKYVVISIHALLAESDCRVDFFSACCIIISIHALLAESDEENPTQKREAKAFLSTLSLRRATCRCVLSG